MIQLYSGQFWKSWLSLHSLQHLCNPGITDTSLLRIMETNYMQTICLMTQVSGHLSTFPQGCLLSWVHCIILCLFASVHWPTFKFYSCAHLLFFLPPWVLKWYCGNFINFYRLECRLCGRIVTLFLPKILRRPTRKQSRRTTKNMTSTSSQSANYIPVFMPSLYLLLWWYLTIIMVILRLWHLY